MRTSNLENKYLLGYTLNSAFYEILVRTVHSLKLRDIFNNKILVSPAEAADLLFKIYVSQKAYGCSGLPEQEYAVFLAMLTDDVKSIYIRSQTDQASTESSLTKLDKLADFLEKASKAIKEIADARDKT